MLNLFLKLESGQQLRLLPFNEDSFYDKSIMWYCQKLQKYFVYNDTSLIDFEHREKVYRNIKYHLPVEYKDEIYFIKIGRKIKDMIDKIISDNDFKVSDFLKYDILLNVKVTKVQISTGVIVPNYDECSISVKSANDYWEFFKTPQYATIKEMYDKYINNMQLVKSPKILNYLNDNNLLEPAYQFLMRSSKINDIRSRKVNTTKTKLWNQVINMVGETANENDHIEDIGYLDKNEDNENVHQFMVDGYLFEIKIVDDV